jgi:chromosome segregation ATPase
MTIQEIINQFGNVVLDGELAQRLTSIVKKLLDIQALETAKQEMMTEITRLNTKRVNLRQENQKVEQDLENERQTLMQEISSLNTRRAGLQDIKAKNEKKLADIEKLQNEINTMPKDTEIKKKYDETKKLMENLKKNLWLASNVRENIQKIWKELPADELDKVINH